MLLCLECLENILLYTASLEALSQSDTGSGMGLSPGHKLVGTILRDHMRPIYSSLMTSCPMKLVAACLRLLTAMVLQGHHSARDVQQNFNFTYKSLVVFPNRTNRVKVYTHMLHGVWCQLNGDVVCHSLPSKFTISLQSSAYYTFHKHNTCMSIVHFLFKRDSTYMYIIILL